MIARALLLVCVVGLVGPCETRSSTTDAPAVEGDAPAGDGDHDWRGRKRQSKRELEDPPNPDYLDCEPPLACSMKGLWCPSSTLPRLEGLSAADWSALQGVAAKQMVALDLSPDAAVKNRIVESCRVPGSYLEVVAAPESPGRGWAADRLVFTPDELRDCKGATHFVAAFALRNDGSDGSAIVLPLPCPEFGSGVPDYCVGAGLDDDARLELVRARWELVSAAVGRGDAEGIQEALTLLVEVAALQPNAINYVNVAKHMQQIDERYGGCLWLSEATFAAQRYEPSFTSRVDVSQGRVVPSHEFLDCYTRPSLLTCLPEHFVPGVGDNCW